MSILLFSFFVLYQANAQPLVIINQDYEQAKKISKEQGKLLLIDFYTTWCTPCKYLDKAVFMDTAVSNEIAKNFILLKYDAEKDSLHQLTLKHHILMYPSTVVLNMEQRVVSQLYGTGGSEKELVNNYTKFLQEAVSAAANNSFIKGISASTALDYPQFYRDYVNRTNTKDAAAKAIVYWNSRTDYISEVPFAIMSYFDGGTDAVNQYFASHQSDYEELYGKTAVLWVSNMIVSKKFYTALDMVSRPGFDSASVVARQLLKPSSANRFIDYMNERLFQAEGNWIAATRLFEKRKNGTPPLEAGEIAYYCQTATEKCTDKSVLKKCTEWMKAISGQAANLENLDLYARLLYMTGNKKQAVIKMKQAIAAGQAANENTKNSQDWLKKNS